MYLVSCVLETYIMRIYIIIIVYSGGIKDISLIERLIIKDISSIDRLINDLLMTYISWNSSQSDLT